MLGYVNYEEVMMPKSVLLDTSFFLRFLNDNDPLYANADGYFRHFLREDMTCWFLPYQSLNTASVEILVNCR